AQTLLNLGALYHLIPRTEAARRCYERAREITQALAHDDPEVTSYQADLALTCNSLGAVLRKLDPDERSRLFQHELSAAMGQLVRLLRESPTDPSRRLHLQALRILEALVKKPPEQPEVRQELAGTCANLGPVALEANDPGGARGWCDGAFREVGPVKGQPSARPVLLRIPWVRAEALGKLGRPRPALPDWDRAVELGRPGEPERDMVRHERAFALA